LFPTKKASFAFNSPTRLYNQTRRHRTGPEREEKRGGGIGRERKRDGERKSKRHRE